MAAETLTTMGVSPQNSAVNFKFCKNVPKGAKYNKVSGLDLKVSLRKESSVDVNSFSG